MNQAIILAGGKGTRLRNLTDFVPKSLLPLNGEAALESIIRDLVGAGITEVLLSLDYLKEPIQDFIESKDGFGINIKCIDSYIGDQKDRVAKDEVAHNGIDQHGTAIALYQLKDLVQDDFLLCACDTLFPKNYVRELIEFHEKEKNHVTLSVSDLGAKKHLIGRSVVGLGPKNDITRIIEKPSEEEVFSTIVSTPMYAFNKAIFDYIPKIGPSKRGEYELQSAIQMMIDDACVVKGFMNKDWNDLANWQMLNDCYDFLRLNFPYLKEKLEPR